MSTKLSNFDVRGQVVGLLSFYTNILASNPATELWVFILLKLFEKDQK